MSENSTNSFWVLLDVMARRRTLIVSIVMIATLVALAVAFLAPKWYRAEALLLPPKNATLPVSGFARISEFASVTEGLQLPILVTPTDVYTRMLSSRTITDVIITKFDLQTRYRASNSDETYLTLMDLTEFRATDEGLLQVTFEDRDPQMAADVTNAFVNELDRISRDIASNRVRQSKGFIEARLAQVEVELDSARAAFERFQLDNRAIDFDEQISLALEQATQLKIRLAEIDIDLQIRSTRLGEGNAELVELRQRREAISDRLDELELRNPDSSFFSLPVAAIPSLRGQFEMLYSKVRINESLYRLLLEQYEQIKIQQNEDAPILSVLDWARVPEIRSWPRRAIIVGGTFGCSLIFAILLAALLEYFRRVRQRSEEDYQRAVAFMQAYFGWLPGLKNRDQV
jgi:tyrosine-protein kinase Etk/Wzc